MGVPISIHARELLDELRDFRYGTEPSERAIRIAKENDFIIVFGHSDDCLEIRGAIYDEFYSAPRINEKGVIYPECDCNDCPHERRINSKASTIKWTHENHCHEFVPVDANGEELDIFWTFDQIEDDEVYAKCFIAHLSEFKVD